MLFLNYIHNFCFSFKRATSILLLSTTIHHLWLCRLKSQVQNLTRSRSQSVPCTASGGAFVRADDSGPLNLRYGLRVSFGLHDGEGLLLLTHLFQPLLLQKRHQRVPHFHHLNYLLKNLILFYLLLGSLVCRTKRVKIQKYNLHNNNNNN